MSSKAFGRWIIILIALGYLVRARALAYGFPVNDGGLFYAMTRDLSGANFRIPSATTYNFQNIPFAYPPLGLYVAGLMERFTPLSLINIFRYVPVAVSTLTIVAFVILARAMVASRRSVVIATATFAFFPLSFLWLTMGGGITRGFGMLFALLALHQLHEMYRDGAPRRYVAGAAVCCALTVLSHLETGWFVAFSAILFVLPHQKTRDRLLRMVVVGVATTLLTAPWWGTVLKEHGLSPFVAAWQAGRISSVAPLLAFRQMPLSEPLYALLTSLGLLGFLCCLMRRAYLLPLWMVVGAVLDPRAFPTFATIPLALLVSVAVNDVLYPLAQRNFPLSLRTKPSGQQATSPNWLIPGAVTLGLFFAAFSALVAEPRMSSGMGDDELGAMVWSEEHSAPNDAFVIVTGDRWATDRTSEWFPALTSRRSVGTVQGYEWIEGGFHRQEHNYVHLQYCAERDGDCLEAWAGDSNSTFEYVYLTKILPASFKAYDRDDCCAALRAALRRDGRYEEVFDNSAATIFRRL